MKKENPKISIVIPVYNGEKTIIDSINSVLNQTYKNFEIIIVDDGSTDNTKKILKKIKSDKIRYYYQNNKGQSSARNLGVSKAKGIYVSFNDADDQWNKNKLNIFVDFINKVKNKDELGFIFHDCRITSETFSTKSYFNEMINKHEIKSLTLSRNNKYRILDGSILLYHILGGFFITSPMIFIKKEIFNKFNGYNENLRYAEDIELFVRICQHCNIGYIDKSLYTYKKINNSITIKNLYNATGDTLNVIIENKPNLNNSNKIMIKKITKQISILFLRLSYLNFKNKCYIQSSNYLYQSFKNSCRYSIYIIIKDIFKHTIGKLIPHRLYNKLRIIYRNI